MGIVNLSTPFLGFVARGKTEVTENRGHGKPTPSHTWPAVRRDINGELAEDPVGGIAFVVNLLHTGACSACPGVLDCRP